MSHPTKCPKCGSGVYLPLGEVYFCESRFKSFGLWQSDTCKLRIVRRKYKSALKRIKELETYVEQLQSKVPFFDGY